VLCTWLYTCVCSKQQLRLLWT